MQVTVDAQRYPAQFDQLVHKGGTPGGILGFTGVEERVTGQRDRNERSVTKDNEQASRDVGDVRHKTSRVRFLALGVEEEHGPSLPYLGPVPLGLRRSLFVVPQGEVDQVVVARYIPRLPQRPDSRNHFSQVQGVFDTTHVIDPVAQVHDEVWLESRHFAYDLFEKPERVAAQLRALVRPSVDVRDHTYA
jgi:hypothetical protein